MQDAGGEGRAAGLDARVARLEAQLRSYSNEIAALQVELHKLRDEQPASEFLRVKKPAAPVSRPWLPPPPAPSSAVPQPETVFAAAAVPPPPNFYAAESKPHGNRSVENQIGSQWLNRVGIVALLIAVTLALKFAVEKHWIHFTQTGRIVTGLVLGTAVALWSERFRRKGYSTFSYSLKAVGTGTLYLTLWASFHLYHLLPAPVALTMMIAVTAWNAIMAWAQDAELLAVYALVGGFATPALLGSGGNHEVFLFSYVLAMDVAVLLLLVKKPWQRLLFGSFPGTVVYFIGWYTEFFTKDQAGITALFVVLLTMPFAALALAGRQRDKAGEGLLAPLVAASFFACAMYSVLQDSDRHAWLPWTAVAAAAVYLLLMRVRREGLAEAMHLAIAIIFLTIAIPLKAEGRWITVGWLAEGVALLWVAGKLLGPDVQARVRSLMRWLGCIALALGVGESLIFWASEDALHAFWNGRFWTEMGAVAALALAAWLARHPARDDSTEPMLNAPGWPVIAMGCTLVAHLVAPLALGREISAYWSASQALDAGYRSQLTATSVAALLMVYGAALIGWTTLRESEETAQRRLLIMLACGYLALGSLTMVATPIAGSGGPARVVWNARLLMEIAGAAALATTAWLAWQAKLGRESDAEFWATVAAWCLLAFNLLVVLAGVREVMTYFNLQASADDALAEAFSISAWLMIYAAALLAVGFWKRTAFVRWQGLVLLVFTIGKVFLYDVHSLSSGYRILSFFGLGVVLMTVSFAYQKDWLGLKDPTADNAADEATP
jgi:uncharacterized membrane protein